MLGHRGFPSQATERNKMSQGLTVSSAVIFAYLFTANSGYLSLQTGVSKRREFNLSPVCMSKFALKSAYMCLRLLWEL